MIALYRKGATHTIRGVTCEMGRFETKRLQSLLDSGWVTNPQALLEVEEEEVVEVVAVAEVVKPKVNKPKKTRKPRKEK